MAAAGLVCLSYRAMEDNQFLSACAPARTFWPAGENPPQRILVVEDDAVIREFAVQVLIRCGFEVDAAEDGAVAWDTLQTGRFDLIVTDNNMPNVTGVDLLKKLHAAQVALPVIMATGSLPQDEFTRSPWLQPAATLLKPYTIEQLLGTVKKVLRATAVVCGPVAEPANPQGLPAAGPRWQ